MSLDKRIKGMAEARVTRLIEDAGRALEPICKNYGLHMNDVARLMSQHKTKTTHAAIVKQFSDAIAQRMLESAMSTDEIRDDIEG